MLAQKRGWKFHNSCLCDLQKQGWKYDIYNVTMVLELLEKMYNDKYIGVKVASVLCMGENDFILKFVGINHATVLKQFLLNTTLRANLLQIFPHFQLCLDSYVKILYCPKHLKEQDCALEQIQISTMSKKFRKNNYCQ